VAERRRQLVDRRLAGRGGRRQADYAGRAVVLIVDDHIDSRDLLAAVLLETGVSIAEAGTGKEALERIVSDPRPDLILMDLSLPDCHGTEIVRTLKRDPRTRDIPVFALSAAVMPSDKEAAASAGCAGFIEKPVMPDEVVELVRRALAGAGATRSLDPKKCE